MVIIIKKVLFIKNALILTVTAIILRLAGILFKVWTADKLGAEGVGLYQLVFSVYVLAATFATSGICTAVTRLITEEEVFGSEATIRSIMKKSVIITLAAAILSSAAVYFSSDFISAKLLCDARATPALKILCFSLPFMGISSCIRGYFIARRKTVQPSVSQIIEQLLRIIIVVFLVVRFEDRGLTYTCAAVLFGDTAAECLSCLVLYLMYRSDTKKLDGLSGRVQTPYGIGKKIMSIALPISGGRYMNSILRTAENILVPKALQKSSLSAAGALSVFGNIKGMALPILLFPSSLLNSISTLLIPEMSEAMAKKSDGGIRRTVARLFSITFAFGFITGVLFFVLGENLGMLIYKSRDVGFLIKALSPLIPIMYIDSVADGMLKGLDQQLICFRNCMLDSSLRIILILVFVSRFGIYGFIGVMYVSNILTACLNCVRLMKISKTSFSVFNWLIKPLFAAIIAVYASVSAVRILGTASLLLYTAFVILIASALYCAVMIVTADSGREIIQKGLKKTQSNGILAKDKK